MEATEAMEDIKKLGEMALKLEKYRYSIISSLSWVIFGMFFSATAVLCNSLILFGIPEWIWALLLLTAIAGGYTYKKFWMFVPREERTEKRWSISIILLTIPFVVTYSVLPSVFNFSPFYYSVIWYPSLGLGLLLSSIYIGIRSMSYTGILMLLTSAIFLQIPRDPLAANLLGIGMMLLIYLTSFLHSIFRAQEIIYAR